MEILHRFDGNLCAFLWNEGTTRATAHIAFTVVNKADAKSEFGGGRFLTDSNLSKLCLSEGCFEELFPALCKDYLGFSLYPAAEVNDWRNGFMKNGFFRVRAEIRLKLQDNERWTVSVKRKTATCTVYSTSPSKHFDSWYP